jgi:Skp family chaperone for outer membrane proteins
MSLEEEEELFDDYYNNDKINEDPDYTKKIYSQRDFDYQLERELIRVERKNQDKVNQVRAELSKAKDKMHQMEAKLEKVEKMEALLDRYALHSEIDYDKNTYEFIGYDDRK